MTREAIAKAIWEAGMPERHAPDTLNAMWVCLVDHERAPFYKAADAVLALPSAEEEHL